MSNTAIFNLVVAIIAFLISIPLLIRRIRRYKLIDVESVAVVKEVIDLGRMNGKRVFAIKYDVMSSSPFELLETPTNRSFAIGKQRAVFYQESNPKENYFFKTIGTFDNRFVVPMFILFCGILNVVGLCLGIF